jgi:hypothetical protein
VPRRAVHSSKLGDSSRSLGGNYHGSCPGCHDSQTAFETTDDLSAQLRATEERIRELEAKVRLLEDRADQAEKWVYKIWVEIEQKFFGGDAVRFLEPPYTQAERP